MNNWCGFRPPESCDIAVPQLISVETICAPPLCWRHIQINLPEYKVLYFDALYVAPNGDFGNQYYVRLDND